MFKSNEAIVMTTLTALALVLWCLAASTSQPLAVVMGAIVLNSTVVRPDTFRARLGSCWIPVVVTSVAAGLYVSPISAMFLLGAALLGLIVSSHVIDALRCYSGWQEQTNDTTLDEDSEPGA